MSATVAVFSFPDFSGPDSGMYVMSRFPAVKNESWGSKIFVNRFAKNKKQDAFWGCWKSPVMMTIMQGIFF